MDSLKMYFLLKTGIFHSYVSLPEGNDELHTVRKEALGERFWAPLGFPLDHLEWQVTRRVMRAVMQAFGTMHRLPSSSIP